MWDVFIYLFINLKEIAFYVDIAPEKKWRMLSFISKRHSFVICSNEV